MEKLILLFFIVLLLLSSYSRAEDIDFATSKEEIIDFLIKHEAKQKTKTRSITGTETLKTRGIRIVTEKKGEIVGKTIYLFEKEPIQGVNLKIKFDFDSYALISKTLHYLYKFDYQYLNYSLHYKVIISH